MEQVVQAKEVLEKLAGVNPGNTFKHKFPEIEAMEAARQEAA